MSSTTNTSPSEEQKILLKDIAINDKSMAVNVMIAMLDAAQRRGAFNLEESSKIWECIHKIREPAPTENVSMDVTEVEA